METEYDAIVIGSGVGGLTTAAILSRAANKKVLVLERHYEIGGLSHEFRRGPFSFDVGLHYVGKAIHKSLGRKILNFVTDGGLGWNSMEEVHEKFVFPDFSIDVSSDRRKYRDDLCARFPDEKKAICRYFRDVNRARLWFVKNYFASFFGPVSSTLIQGLNAFSRKISLMTVKEYLDTRIENPELKAVLAARWGDYGLPPSEAAFCIHAVVEDHYMDGGYFPDGGTGQIALQMERVIEQNGGSIRTNCEVTEIVIENRTAKGVRYRSLTNGSSEPMQVDAPLVISATGFWSTYNRLLPASLELPIQRRLDVFPMKYSAVSLYLGLRDSVETIGQTGANQWLYDTYDFDSHIDENANKKGVPAKAAFISFPSMKSNKSLMHTAEVIAFMPYELFAKWEDEPWKQRSLDYYSFKERITENLLTLIESKIPGFSKLVVFKELATPLTIVHFTGKKMGSLYGLPCTPERFFINELSAHTDVKNLIISGADIGALGMMGALLGGVAAASVAMGPAGFLKIMVRASRALRKKETFVTTTNPIDSPCKMNAKIIQKSTIAPNTYRTTFQLPVPVKLSPGQHVKVEVASGEWRAYTLEEIENQRASLLVDTKHGGPGSRFMDAAAEGDTMLLRLPLPDFAMPHTHTSVLMFATSVGSSLIISVLQELQKQQYKGPLKLFFGAPSESSIFVQPLLQKYEDDLDMEIVYCVDKVTTSRAKHPELFCGTVVDAFESQSSDGFNGEAYVCGNPYMVQNVVQMLHRKGVTKIYW